METVASVRAQGMANLENQKRKNEAILLKAIILNIDILVEALADRLENPNKSFGFIGSRAPVAETDTKFSQCILDIKTEIGNILPYRIKFGTPPPQYEKLKTVLNKIIPSGNKKDKYSEERIEFLYRFNRLLLVLEQGGYISCRSYPRVSNLFKGTTTGDKYKINFKEIKDNLGIILNKIDNAIERKEIDEVAAMALSLEALEVKKDMPSPPSGNVLPEEPPPAIPEVKPEEIESTPTTEPTTKPKTPLTNRDKMIIAGMAANITKDPRTQARNLTTDQIRQMAENIYRKQKGLGRKTYRKKKVIRKSRKASKV